jgi:hypothetical protein
LSSKAVPLARARDCLDDTPTEFDYKGGMQPRLRSGIWVQALIRRYDSSAIPATIVRKGDSDSGAILIKLNRRENGCAVLTQARGDAGELIWLRGTGPAAVDEATADAYIARQAKRDPDLWVIEIEDPKGEPLFDGRIV